MTKKPLATKGGETTLVGGAALDLLERYEAAATKRHQVFVATSTPAERLSLALRFPLESVNMEPFHCGHVDEWLSPLARSLVHVPEAEPKCLTCLMEEVTARTSTEIHPEHFAGEVFFTDSRTLAPYGQARYYSALLEYLSFLRLPTSQSFLSHLEVGSPLLFVVWAQLTDFNTRNWLGKPTSYTIVDSSLQFISTLESVRGVFEPDDLAEALGLH